ncbi:glutathione S-transferase N-terminal domain-containing protein [Pacificimonas sp. ICDLI1SI03]
MDIGVRVRTPHRCAPILRQQEHKSAEHFGINPQVLLPALEIDGAILTQSLAICEYLDE